MKQSKPSFSHMIKTAVCVVALVNLAVLFLFQYELPSFFTSKAKEIENSAAAESESDTTETEPEPTAEEAAYTFSFDPDPLTYDGTTELDLLSGVSLTDPNGNAVDTLIFTNIRTADAITSKTIEYFAETEDGRVSATRGLQLANYSGPSITLPETLPEIDESMLNSVLSAMPTDGTFRADDGFGNDITSSITYEYTQNEASPNLVHYTFTITNKLNDSVSVEADLTLGAPKPVITLTTDAVTVAANTYFNPISYVATAVDVDGSSIFERIIINGNVNTGVPGTYVLEYMSFSPDGTRSLPKTLTVTVQ